MVDVPLLRKAVEWVEEQVLLPKSVRIWDQAEWGCDTAMCVAGKVCHDAGWAFGEIDGEIVKDGVFARAGEEAQRLLGLSSHEAHLLFIATIKRTDEETAVAVRRTAERICGERL